MDIYIETLLAGVHGALGDVIALPMDKLEQHVDMDELEVVLQVLEDIKFRSKDNVSI